MRRLKRLPRVWSWVRRRAHWLDGMLVGMARNGLRNCEILDDVKEDIKGMWLDRQSSSTQALHRFDVGIVERHLHTLSLLDIVLFKDAIVQPLYTRLIERRSYGGTLSNRLVFLDGQFCRLFVFRGRQSLIRDHPGRQDITG